MAVTRRKKHTEPAGTRWRFYTAVFLLFGVFSALIARAAYIQVISPDAFSLQGDMRSLRASSVAVQRGLLLIVTGVNWRLASP